MSKQTKPKFQSTAAREKYDQEFSEAMKLKLNLNREGRLQALRRSIAIKSEKVKKDLTKLEVAIFYNPSYQPQRHL